MNVSAIYKCFLQGIHPKLGDDLAAFILLVKACIERYEAEQWKVPITSEQFDGHPELDSNAFSNAFRLVESDGFYKSASIDEGGQARDQARVLDWQFTVHEKIRKYRDVETIEDYLAVRKVVNKGVREFLLPDTVFDSATGELSQEALFTALEPILEDISRTVGASSAEQTPPKVFVSHSHVDDTFAERLAEDLRAAGADAWFDKRDMGAGSFPARINAALENCEWFLLVLTQDAATSIWVREEFETALVLKHSGHIHELIFVQAGPVERSKLPPLWQKYNAFDATTDYPKALSNTLKEVGLSSHL